MKRSEAAAHLGVIVLAIQRYRGIGKEVFGPGSAELAFKEGDMERLWPWIWGEKCPLPLIVRVLDHYQDSGELAFMDYFNFMFLLFTNMYVVATACITIYARQLPPGMEFPKDVLSLSDVMKGWDDED